MVVAEALLVGLAIGAILGLIGAGGAVVAVPAFLYLFGLAPLQATTASLAVVAAAAATGAVPRLRLGQVRMRQALVFWAVGIAGTLIGSRLAHVVPGVVIVVGFAVVMAGAAVSM
ncbi:MAG: TSUP family transporter, partial [Candidatus Nanopelagicales bacterium]